MNHTFEEGRFEGFRALMTFHLGAYGLAIRKETSFEYDGTTMKYEGGTYVVPQLRGVFGQWYVLAGNTTAQYTPAPAGVMVGPSDVSGREQGTPPVQVTTTFQEESIVGSVEKSAARREGRSEQLPVDALSPAQGSIRHMAADVSDEVVVGSALPQSRPQPTQDQQGPLPLAPLGSMEQQLTASGAYEKLEPPDQDAVRRADALNAATLRASLAQPVKKSANMGGNRVDSLVDPEDIPKGGKGKFVGRVLDEGDVQVVRGVQDTGGASVAAMGQAVAEVKGVNIFGTTAEQIESRAKPIGTPRVAGAGPNRALTVEQLEPPLPALPVAHVTQVASEGNVGMDDIHPSGATGDVSDAMSGSELSDLLPDAIVAGQVGVRKTSDHAVAEKWVAENSGLHWKSRVKLASEMFGGAPELLEAICSLETSGVAKALRGL
jgi:hypothetical protein